MNRWDRLEQVERVLEEHHMAIVGDVLLQHVHERLGCVGRHCAVHNPSQHYMLDWPVEWLNGRGLWRKCEHGVLHADPDQILYWRVSDKPWQLLALHACDGCCETGGIDLGEVVGPQGT